jgi:hypothetical protein
MVIRLVSVSEQMPLPEFHDVFRTILGWNGDLGCIIRVHGQEFNSFRRKTRSKAIGVAGDSLRGFKGAVIFQEICDAGRPK